MGSSKTVFAQSIEPLHRQVFDRNVRKYDGNLRARTFSCRDQYLCMAFAQLAYREGLRDIESCLRSRGEQLYHMGFRSKISRSTLADANDARDWRIYSGISAALINKARQLYSDEVLEVDLGEAVYALSLIHI